MSAFDDDALAHVASSPSSSPALLEITGLCKRYGAIEALKGLDLRLGEGDVYGFLGRNGAGKTTTIRAIMGITRATSGRMRLMGREISGADRRARQMIGYVAQEQNFYGWMTAESIGRFVSAFYPRWEDAEYRRLLGVLEIPRGQKLRTFSQGNSTKLALALALAHRPPLLVLDEPTAGMDAVTRREFMEIVRDQAERSRRTTLFSSHLIDEVEVAADRIGIIEDGRMLYEGSKDRLRATVHRLVREVDAGAPDERLPLPAAVGLERGIAVLQDQQRDGQRSLTVRVPEASDLDVLRRDGWRVEPMSLESIFVDLVTRHRSV